jgi:hypothetical protein
VNAAHVSLKVLQGPGMGATLQQQQQRAARAAGDEWARQEAGEGGMGVGAGCQYMN